MNRTELIDCIARRMPDLTRRDAELAVHVILASLAGTLRAGGRIEIRDFGTFCLNYRAEHAARNPKTGSPVVVPGKWVPHFKPGRALRVRVDEAKE